MAFPFPSVIDTNAAPFPLMFEAWKSPPNPPVPEETPKIPAAPKFPKIVFTSPLTAALTLFVLLERNDATLP
ncbi:hypothetical protein D3C86_1663060 [compost metagenome]